MWITRPWSRHLKRPGKEQGRGADRDRGAMNALEIASLLVPAYRLDRAGIDCLLTIARIALIGTGHTRFFVDELKHLRTNLVTVSAPNAEVFVHDRLSHVRSLSITVKSSQTRPSWPRTRDIPTNRGSSRKESRAQSLRQGRPQRGRTPSHTPYISTCPCVISLRLRTRQLTA